MLQIIDKSLNFLYLHGTAVTGDASPPKGVTTASEENLDRIITG
jgi:hypothetical protein